MAVEFKAWPKIPRNVLSDVYITEKMNGTNACIIIEGGAVVGVQSRKRFITPGKDNDNYGLAGWVERNMDNVLLLGDGRHYGEWTGLGINGNDHNLEDKQYYLFDTRRWHSGNLPPEPFKVVRILVVHEYSTKLVEDTMCELKAHGEAQGYTPEGIIIYFPKLDLREKVTFNFNKGKWNT